MSRFGLYQELLPKIALFTNEYIHDLPHIKHKEYEIIFKIDICDVLSEKKVINIRNYINKNSEFVMSHNLNKSALIVYQLMLSNFRDKLNNEKIIHKIAVLFDYKKNNAKYMKFNHYNQTNIKIIVCINNYDKSIIIYKKI